MAGTKYYATIADKGLETSEASLGSANTDALKSAFSSSPIYSKIALVEGEEKIYDEEELPAIFKALALDGEVIGGNGFNQFNRDYSDGTIPSEKAPDVAAVTNSTDGELLYSPYMPNPTSPGAGNGVDASKKPMHSVPPKTPNDIMNKNFGAGFNSVYNPVASSQAIEEQGIKRTSGKSSLTNTP